MRYQRTSRLTLRTVGNPSRGFSLVEMIVAVGLFSIVMLTVSGAYFNLISLDRQARATNQVVSNLSFAVETMVRGIRTGTGYKCNGVGGNGSCTSFAYDDSNIAKTVVYIKKANGTIGRCENDPPLGNTACQDVDASPLTDPLITITQLSFYVRGVGTSASPESAQQPQVQFVLQGTMPTGKGAPVTFSIQESATQRLIDL